MDTKPTPLRERKADLEGVLGRCYDSGEPLIVELPNRGLVSFQPVESDDLVDELIEHNPAFRELLAKSLASPREQSSLSFKGKVANELFDELIKVHRMIGWTDGDKPGE